MHGRGNGGEYQYFYCLGRQAQRDGCDLPYMRVEELELAVAAYQPKIEKLGERVEAIRSELRTYLDTYAEQAEQTGEPNGSVWKYSTAKAPPAVLRRRHLRLPLQKEQQRIRRERSSAEEIIDATQLDPDEIDEAWRVLSHAVDRADDIYPVLPDELKRISNQFAGSAPEIDHYRVADQAWATSLSLSSTTHYPDASETSTSASSAPQHTPLWLQK
ncbi:MAG: zinc ribbon domain-containing protein [Acidimicrobiales bacterium]